jgi:hypothetical protein
MSRISSDSYFNPEDEIDPSGSEDYIVWWMNIMFFLMQETINSSHNILFADINRVKKQLQNTSIHTLESVSCELNKL